jgi:hypothetical protein
MSKVDSFFCALSDFKKLAQIDLSNFSGNWNYGWDF